MAHMMVQVRGTKALVVWHKAVTLYEKIPYLKRPIFA
jgi:hypothetical protein